jgi:hypothetical protein
MDEAERKVLIDLLNDARFDINVNWDKRQLRKVFVYMVVANMAGRLLYNTIVTYLLEVKKLNEKNDAV